MLVLNVDDDSDDRELFCDALKAIDPQISCLHFDSGDTILDFLKTNEKVPDYIFIDINMPRMNGFECVRQIRANTNLKQVPIVMFSTAFNPNDLKEYSNLGINFLTKPTNFANLIESVKSQISK